MGSQQSPEDSGFSRNLNLPASNTPEILKKTIAISLRTSNMSHCKTCRLFYRRVNDVIHGKGISELTE
jgi:hypothetical protein